MTALRLLSVAGQLALVLLTARVFRIEALGGFDRLIPLVLGGFVLHALAPARLRLPLFVLISWAGLVLVLGPVPAAFTVGAGLALIGLIHLPVPFGVRVGLVLAAVTALGFARAGRIDLPAGWGAALPVLGSLFLFRMIVYAYDLRFGKAPASAWHRIAYFFLLPNACFPLFPVVDPKAFARTYYDDEPERIYRKGVRWIARGVLQLVLYRAVYYHLVPAPWEVEGFGTLVRFSVGSYLLYVRISGIFHLIVGILCLFGFNLPETHHRFLFASSFTDFWRRINIYFTGFLAKVVYYPVFTRVRPLGTTPAMLLAIGAVFVATTLFHAWQWFWLRGSFLVTWNDVAFFGVLGTLVMVTAVREARKPRRRGRRNRSFGDDLRHSFAVTGVFALMAFFWGMWSSPSVADWGAMVAGAAPGPREALALVGVLAAIAVAGAAVRTLGDRARAAWPGPAAAIASPTAAILATPVLLLAAAQPRVQDLLGERAGTFVASLTEDRLSDRDDELVVHGYYEGLLEANRLASRAWEADETGDDDLMGPMNRSDGVERHPGLPAYTLKPSRTTTFKTYALRTNEWGMRDRSYAREKPEGTLRIAVLGASYAMGMGVENDEVFEALMEERMNREKPLPGRERIEVLNFAVGGYTVHDQLEILPEVLAFEPDVLLWITTPKLRALSLTRLTQYLTQGRQRESGVLREVQRIAGFGAGDDLRTLRRVLESSETATTGWALERIAEEARAHGCLPVAAMIPTARSRDINAIQRQWMGLAEKAGFTTIILDGVYGDVPESEITVGKNNDHPSALGHRLIADRLYEDLVGAGGILRDRPER